MGGEGGGAWVHALRGRRVGAHTRAILEVVALNVVDRSILGVFGRVCGRQAEGSVCRLA